MIAGVEITEVKEEKSSIVHKSYHFVYHLEASMLKSIKSLIVICIFIISTMSFAFAEEATVTIDGLNTYGRINMFEDGQFLGQFMASEFKMYIDGEFTYGYCAEFAVEIGPHIDYSGDVYSTEPMSPWCELSYILGNYQAVDDFSGSVLQLAVWKLVHSDRNLTTDNVDVENEANALLEEAEGICPLSCFADDVYFTFDGEQNNDGTGSATVTLVQNDMGVAGQTVNLSVQNAVLVDPADGVAVTDENGQFEVLFDVLDTESSVTLEVTTEGHELLYIELGDDVQDLTSYAAGDSCVYQISEEFGPVVEECGTCEGFINYLELQYNGKKTAEVEIYQGKGNKCKGKKKDCKGKKGHGKKNCHKKCDKKKDSCDETENLLFSGVLNNGETFSFTGNEADGSMGKKITIFVNGKKHVKHIKTECDRKHTASVGSVFKDFSVISASSTIGGEICEEEPTGLLCSDHNKPRRLEMLYTGETCDASSNTQDPSKALCSDVNNLENLVYVKAYNNKGVYFEGLVDLNSTFFIDAANAGQKKLQANTYVLIYNADQTELLQDLEFHTSCSQPLNVGDQFGSLVIVGFNPQQ